MGYQHSRGKQSRGTQAGNPHSKIDKTNNVRKSGGTRKRSARPSGK